MGIENLNSKAELLAFIRQELQVPPNLQGALAVLTSKLTHVSAVNIGTSSVTITAATFSPVVTVAHGLGAVPALVAVFARQPSALRLIYNEEASADATNFKYRGLTSDSATVTGTQNTYWLAVA